MKKFDKDEIAAVIDAARRHRLTFVSVTQGEREVQITLPGDPPAPRSSSDDRLEDARALLEPESYVRSTLVGFFREASPEFAVGSRVEPETVIGVVEALGLPNEVAAGVSGRIEEILVSDGEPVEYGQPLARVRTEAAALSGGRSGKRAPG